MTKQRNRSTASQIVVESALTKSMYGWILLMLGVRSWGFALLAGIGVFLVWTSVTQNNYTLLVIYSAALVVIYGGAVLVSIVTKKNRTAYKTVKYTFDESKIVKEAGTAKQTLAWNTLFRWRKLGPYYLIYATRRSFFVIPRNRIPEGRVGDFELLVRQNIVKRQPRLFR